MPIIHISDPDDVRVAPYRNVRERDLTGRQGLFVAEGTVVLRSLVCANRFRARSLLVLENRLAGLENLLSAVAQETPVYVANRAVIDAVAGFPMHRGVLAIGERGEPSNFREVVAGLPAQAVVVVCVGISNHDNIGAIFRNAAAFGAAAVLLDASCCDPLYRKALRVSVGAVLTVPFAVAPSADDIVDALDRAGFRQLALTPAGVSQLRDVRSEGRTAIFLGTEGSGLPQSLIQRIEGVSIRMADGFDSLNVAAASAIALHHLAMD